MDGTVKAKITADSSELTQALQRAQNGLKELGVSGINCRKDLRKLTQEIATLTAQYDALDESTQKSAFGRDLQNTIQAMTVKAGKLKDAMLDTQQAIMKQASDSFVYDAIGQSITVASQSMQAFATITGFANGNSEKFKKTLEKLAQIQTVANAAISITNMLQKQGSIIQGVMTARDAVVAKIRQKLVTIKAAEAVVTEAETQAEVKNTAASAADAVAKTAQAEATASATAAQVALNIAADANPYVLLASAILAVGSALYFFIGREEEATEAEKQHAKATEALNKRQREMNETIGKKSGELVGTYKALKREWEGLRTEAEKTKWINDNQSAFNTLGISVNNVNDAYKAFVQNAPQVIAALRKIAEAEALKDLYKGAVSKREEFNRQNGQAKYRNAYADQNSITQAEYQEAGATSSKKVNELTGDLYDSYEPTKENLEKVNALRAKKAREALKDQKKVYDDEANYYSRRMGEAQADALDSQNYLSTAGGTGKNGGGKGGNTPTENQKEEKRLIEEINDEIKKQQDILSDLEVQKSEITDPEELNKVNNKIRDVKRTLSGLQNRKWQIDFDTKWGDNADTYDAWLENITHEIEDNEYQLTFTADPNQRAKLEKEIQDLVYQKEYGVKIHAEADKKYSLKGFFELDQSSDDVFTKVEEGAQKIREELRGLPFSERDYKRAKREMSELAEGYKNETLAAMEALNNKEANMANSGNIGKISREVFGDTLAKSYGEEGFFDDMADILYNMNIILSEGKIEIFDDNDNLKETINLTAEEMEYLEAMKKEFESESLWKSFAGLSSEIDELQKKDFLTPIVKGMNDVNGVASELTGSIFSATDAWIAFGEQVNEMSQWEKFEAIVNNLINSFDALSNIIDTVGTVVSFFANLMKTSQVATEEETVALVANATAKQTAAGINAESAALTATANYAEAQSARALTAALNTAAYAAIPFAGPALAGAAQGTYEALWAAASLPMFAEGGIVQGSSLSGDKVLARLNSQEMVLNKRQQANLFALLDGQVSGGNKPNKVEFVIRGDKLQGVLNNHNNKRRKL